MSVCASQYVAIPITASPELAKALDLERITDLLREAPAPFIAAMARAVEERVSLRGWARSTSPHAPLDPEREDAMAVIISSLPHLPNAFLSRLAERLESYIPTRYRKRRSSPGIAGPELHLVPSHEEVTP